MMGAFHQVQTLEFSQPTKGSRQFLCRSHFTDDGFANKRKVQTGLAKDMQLVPNAVQTIQLGKRVYPDETSEPMEKSKVACTPESARVIET